MKIQLKKEFAEKAVGFNGSAAPLGERTDLDKLLILAHRSGRADYLAMFDNPPTLEQLQSEDVDAKLAELQAPARPLADNAFPAQTAAQPVRAGAPATGTSAPDALAPTVTGEPTDTPAKEKPEPKAKRK